MTSPFADPNRLTGAALLDELVHRHAREIQLFLFKVSGNHHDAEELAQDVFVKAFRNLDSLRDPKAARRWLFSIAVNHVNDWMRSRRRSRWRSMRELFDFELISNQEKPSSELSAQELGRCIAEAVAALPERQRSVVLLHAARGFAHEDVGQALGISADAAKVNLFHAREKLRRVVDRYYAQDERGA
jgi:RNA polymerase sigma-70 factor, ECF subfamily